MAPVDDPLGPEEIAAAQHSVRAVATAFWGARALQAAVRLGVFDALGAQMLPAEALAQTLRLRPRPLERLLHALVAMGLLERDGNGYRNSAVTRVLLLRDGEHRQSSLVSTLADEWSAWATLEDRLGTDAPATGTRITDSDRLRARRDMASVVAPLVARQIDLDNVRRVLDVGAGPATYSLALARSRPHLEVTIVEAPQRCEVTQQEVAAAALGDRVRIEAASPLEADFGKERYDLVLISDLHTWAPNDARTLIGKAYEATVSEGRCVVADLLLRDDKTGPLDATLLDLQRLICDEDTAAWSGWEITEAMQTVGFIRVQLVPLAPTTHALVVGTRP